MTEIEAGYGDVWIRVFTGSNMMGKMKIGKL